MNLNLLLPALVLLAVFRAWRGFKNGLTDEVHHLISLIAALFVIALAIMIYTCFQNGDTKNGVIAVLFLIATGLLLHILSIVFKSLHAIACLPIIRFANSLLGLAAGVAEVVLASWIMYYIIQIFPTGAFGAQIMAWTEESRVLTRLYEANYITQWISRIGLW